MSAETLAKFGLNAEGLREVTYDESSAEMRQDFAKMIAEATTPEEKAAFQLGLDCSLVVSRTMDFIYNSTDLDYIRMCEVIGNGLGMAAIVALGPSSDPETGKSLREMYGLKQPGQAIAANIILNCLARSVQQQVQLILDGDNPPHLVVPKEDKSNG